MFKRLVLVIGSVVILGTLLVGAGFLLGQQLPILGLQPPVVIIGERVEILTPTPDPLKVREDQLNATATWLAELPGIEATAQSMQTLVAAATQMAMPTIPTQTPRGVQVTSTNQPTLIQTQAATNTTQPAASPTNTPISTVTLTPTETVETLKFAVIEDNSGNNRFRQEAVQALEEAFPDSVVEAYSFCDPRVIAKEYDVVVMDYVMANSPDGVTCTQAILKVHALTKIVGWAPASAEKKFLDAGAEGFVVKTPSNLNLDRLIELIKELIQ